MKTEIKYQFGGRLRAVRERKSITLREVAKKAGVSESLVSQIERNKVSPSIDTLLTIADVLGIDYEYLFSDYKKSRKVSIVKKGKGSRINLNKVTMQQLTYYQDIPEEHSIEAFILEVGVGAAKGDLEYGHAGKEFGVVLEGKGEFVYGTETYVVEEGDSISFASDIPHVLKNTGASVLKAVWVITPPRMIFAQR
jgi:transcriptional regulator with XRE-family HTH domain